MPRRPPPAAPTIDRGMVIVIAFVILVGVVLACFAFALVDVLTTKGGR